MFKYRPLFKTALTTTLTSLFVIAPTLNALSHPHVFAEARLEISTTKSGGFDELRHVWRFDELFSSSVILDFDENQNLQLDPDELIKIGSVVHQSLAEFDYYTNVTLDGKDVKMLAPEAIMADFVDNQLLLIFAMQPAGRIKLEGTITAGIYDPTFYAAMEFIHDSDLVVSGPTADLCKRAVVRPDADEVLAQNQGSLTDAFYDDAENNDLTKLFATRLELTCP
jgi:ABC-type uncharacterized transport system substrate-binding protein